MELGTRFFLKNSGLAVRLEDVVYIRSDRNRVLIKLQQEKKPVSERLAFNVLLPKLPACFQQVHRSCCINMELIAQRLSRHEYRMTDGSPIKVSRSFAEALEERLNWFEGDL